MLKHLPDGVVDWLACLYTSCLSLGYFPRAYKGATVIMIPKDERARQTVDNFRPISLLEVSGKIFERLIKIGRASCRERV